MRVVAGGTGFVGQHLVNRWLQQGHEVSVIGRDQSKIMNIFGSKVRAIDWNVLALKGETLLRDCEVVVNLAGAPIGGKRWNRPYRLELIKSRTQGINTLAHICEKLGYQSPQILQASAVSIYGLQHSHSNTLPIPFDEDVVIRYNRVHDFSSHICHAIERGLLPAINANVNVVRMRFGVVLSPDCLLMKQMKRLLTLGLGGPIGSGYQPFCWITLADLLAAIDYLVAQPKLKGAVNLVAPKCVTQKQFVTALAKHIQRPANLPMPGVLLKLIFGQMAAELMLEGTHAVPKRLLEQGFEFKYPTITKALKAII